MQTETKHRDVSAVWSHQFNHLSTQPAKSNNESVHVRTPSEEGWIAGVGNGVQLECDCYRGNAGNIMSQEAHGTIFHNNVSEGFA